MHFVFTAPRFHTKQHFPAKAFLYAGHKVTFLVLRHGQGETNEALAPSVVGFSRGFDVLRHAAAWLPGVGFSDVGGLPSPIQFLVIMRRLQPAAVAVRETNSAYGMPASCIREPNEDRDRLIKMGTEGYRQVLEEHQRSRYANALVEMATQS